MAIAQQSPSIDEIKLDETTIDEMPDFQLATAIEDVVRRPLELLARLLDGIEQVALVDYPEYANVGDSLIWLGQVALFKRLGKKIVYVEAAWHTDFAALRKVVAQGAAVIITGGGNFGTLWPHHQRFRESLMQKLPAATIIQMPQSICFDDDQALQQFQRISTECPNFHFLARDIPSFNFAKDNFPGSVDLCPDSAFFLGPINAPSADVDVLYLHRSDKECVSVADRIEPSHAAVEMPLDGSPDVAGITRLNLAVKETDWLQQNRSERALQKITRGLIRLRLLRNTNPLMLHLYNVLARVRARRGIRIIACGKCVVTDRLHAHILSVLMGRPNLLLDNSNGKVFAFYEAWTRDWPRIGKVNTVEEAFARARAIVQRSAVTQIAGVLSLLQMALQSLTGDLYLGLGECDQFILALSNGWAV